MNDCYKLFHIKILRRASFTGCTSYRLFLIQYVLTIAAVFDGIHPVIVFQLVGAKHISMGLGLYYCLISVTTIFGTPIAGTCGKHFHYFVINVIFIYLFIYLFIYSSFKICIIEFEFIYR